MRQSSVLRRSGKLQHLVDSIFECDQISRHEFITGAGKFVAVTNLEEFPQTFVGIKAHTIPIRNSDQVPSREAFPSGLIPDRNPAEKTDGQSN